ncbi:hypothetical protein AB4K20DRAFT_1989895 [Rhizopus microsporus]
MVQRSEDDDDTYDCKSFTGNYIWYEIELKNGHLSSVVTALMIRSFRVADVPYALHSDTVVEADTTGLNHEELAVNGINFTDTTNDSTFDNDICQELADSIDRFENLYINDLRR